MSGIAGFAPGRCPGGVGIRVLAVDDHPVVLNGIRAVIAKEHDMAVVAEASDGVAAVELYHEHVPDVVLMDVHMPRLDGAGAIRAIVRMDPAARVVALSGSARDAEICRVLEAGACGYLVKEMLLADVVAAIRAAAAGKRVIPPDVAARLAEFMPRVDLTAREVEVLRLAARGLHNRAIAWAIGRSEETVKVHVRHILAKLGVDDRTAAVTRALRRGIIDLEE